MDSPIQSSFIPHDTAEMSSSGVSYERGGLNDLMLLMSIVLVVASAALAGGVSIYGNLLQTSLTQQKGDLSRVKDQFDLPLIREMNRADARMKAGEKILQSHLSPSAFFTALNQATLSTISFTSLNYTVSATQISVKMTGIAQSVNSIAFQAEVFSKSGIITSPIFSAINRVPGGVTFNLSALVDPNQIKYGDVAASGNGSQTSQGVPAFRGPSTGNTNAPGGPGPKGQ